MTRKRVWANGVLLAALALALVGCSAGSSASAESAEPYGIAFSTEPAVPRPNASASLAAEITKGKKAVADADVIFEIWPKGADAASHYQANAKADGKGSYVLKGQFSEPGTYYVIVHLTPKETGTMTMASFDFEVK